MNEAHHVKQIGALNGPWSIMLRFMLATYPLVMMWAVWVTSQTFANQAFRLAGDRFTREDAVRMEVRINDKFASLPPQDWRDLIKSMASQLQQMNRILNENQIKLTRLETLWETHLTTTKSNPTTKP